MTKSTPRLATVEDFNSGFDLRELIPPRIERSSHARSGCRLNRPRHVPALPKN